MKTLLLIATLLNGTQCAVFLDTSSIEYINIQDTSIVDVNVYDANIGLDSSFKYVGDIDLKVNEFQSKNVAVLCE